MFQHLINEYFRYCTELQSIVSVTLFVQYMMGAMIICVLLCGLLLVSIEFLLHMKYLCNLILKFSFHLNLCYSR